MDSAAPNRKLALTDLGCSGISARRRLQQWALFVYAALQRPFPPNAELAVKISNVIRLLAALSVSLSAALFPRLAAAGALPAPVPMGAYLNGAFPSTAPAVEWAVVDAFPGLEFISPVQLVEVPGSNRLAVVSKRGRIWAIDNDEFTTTKDIILDISTQTLIHDDGGLLGIAFHPEFNVPGSVGQGKLFVWYRYTPDPSHTGRNGYLRLSRFDVDPSTLVADWQSEFVLVQQYDAHDWHNGGSPRFGPDGFLYFCVGDQGQDTFAGGTQQQIDKYLLSGVFRIDVDQDLSRSHPIRRQPQSWETPPAGWPASFTQGYSIPNTNPWQDPGGSVLEEFYSLGVRSPHRMAFDSLTGQLWLGDTGAGAQEEINLIEAGANYQWPYMEGTVRHQSTPSPLIGVERGPVHTYPAGAVVGGFVYRGSRHQAELGGKYLYNDFNSGRVHTLTFNPDTGNWDDDLLVDLADSGIAAPQRLTGVSTLSNGEIYLTWFYQYRTSIEQGKIFKLAPLPPTGTQVPATLSATGAFQDIQTLTPAPGLVPYDVNQPLWSDGATKARWLAVPNNGTHDSPGEEITFATNDPWTYPPGTVLVKHFELGVDENDPSQTTRLETRFLVMQQNGGAYGLTYRWNETGTEAFLLTTSETRDLSISLAGGGTRQQTWTFPSRQDCSECHTAAAGYALGAHTWQLNRDFTYPNGNTDNQLTTWRDLGMFANPFSDVVGLPQGVAIDEGGASAAERVNSYLAANCAHCHRPGAIESGFDARFEVPLDSLIGAPTSAHSSSANVIVAGGDRWSSELYLRDASLGAGAMPPLAKSMVDEAYVAVLESWIDGTCPGCARCDDGVQNGDETGVDCGGTSCTACPSCNDGFQNGDETGVDCGGSCASCPSCSPSTYDALSMVPSTGGQVGDGWNLWSNGTLSTQHDFTSGQAIITVTARGEFAGGAWPNMVLNVGGVALGSVEVASASLTTYSFNIVAAAGVQDLSVEFTNDFYDSPDDRNLIVANVEVACATSAPECGDGICNGQETCGSCDQDCGACPTCNDQQQNGDETGIDCGGSCPPCSTGTTQVWLEAESASLSGNPSFQMDSDSTASGGVFLAPTSNNLSSPGPNRASYSVTVAAGNYVMWARVIAPNGDDDSLWVSVDGGGFIRWNNIAPSSSWTWDSLHDSDSGDAQVTLALSAGTHTLTLANREDGLSVDKLYLSAEGDIPSGLGGGQQCAPSTCAELGAECGATDDGCGTTISCGGCAVGEFCNATNQCVASSGGEVPVSGNTYAVHNVGDGSCLSRIAGGTDNAGTQSCDGGNDQQWLLTDVGGYIKLEVVATGDSLDADGGSGSSGTNLLLWPYGAGQDNRDYTLANLGGNEFQLEARHAPGQCAVRSGSNAQLGPCDGSPNARWTFHFTTGCSPDCAGAQCGDDGCGGSCGSCAVGEVCDASNQCVATNEGPVSGGTYELHNLGGGGCLTRVAAGTDNAAQQSCIGSSDQAWVLTDIGGYHKLEVVTTGDSLDAEGASASPGTNLLLWQYGAGQANREYTLTDLGNDEYQLAARHAPGQCAVRAAGNVELGPCDGGPDSRWTFHSVTP